VKLPLGLSDTVPWAAPPLVPTSAKVIGSVSGSLAAALPEIGLSSLPLAAPFCATGAWFTTFIVMVAVDWLPSLIRSCTPNTNVSVPVKPPAGV